MLEICKMLSEIGMAPKLITVLFIDNQAVIKQRIDEALSLEEKHIDVRLKFVRDCLLREIIWRST